MSARTLLDFAGLVRHPPSWNEAVLVIIDHQREYREGKLVLSGIEEAIAENAKLLEMARAAGAPVIHIVTYGRPGSPIFSRGTPMADIIPELAPLPGEQIVEKSYPSSFAGTVLADKIQATHRRSLIITGFMTHMCVSTTVRAALDFDFKSTIIAAATATRDLPDPLGGIIPAAAVQRTALAELADRFALVMPDAAALAARTTAA